MINIILVTQMGVLLILHMFPKLASDSFFFLFFSFLVLQILLELPFHFACFPTVVFRFSDKRLSFTSALRLLVQCFKCYLHQNGKLAGVAFF